MAYGWLTKTAAVAQLQARLYGSVFWSSAEAFVYITESLRLWNALTEQWNSDYTLTMANGSWIDTSVATNSPRIRTVTDAYLYGQMCYMLMEPQLVSGAWAGTNQFALSDLQTALQKRIQEVIQATACTFTTVTVSATPGTRRYALPDTVLQPRRIRFFPVVVNTTGSTVAGSQQTTLASVSGVAVGQVIAGWPLASGNSTVSSGAFVTAISGSVVTVSLPATSTVSVQTLQFSNPITLTREDTLAMQDYNPSVFQTSGTPQSWSMVSEPPLSFDVDYAPNTAGTFEILALTSGPSGDPTDAVLVGVPDDWSWLPMYGALSDVLSREPEATDKARADYCLKRFTDGLQMMRDSNWLLQASINGVMADTPSIYEKDVYSPEWQQGGMYPSLVQAGIDYIAPTPGYGQSVTMTLVGNAPLLDVTGTYVQVSRDDWSAVLGMAHHVASFKHGGVDFARTMTLATDFYRAAAAVNKRILSYGPMADLLRTEGQRQEKIELR